MKSWDLMKEDILVRRLGRWLESQQIAEFGTAF